MNPHALRHMNLNHACLPFHHFSLQLKKVVVLKNGGVDRIRTDDPHNAIVMLFQLSYNPLGDFLREYIKQLRSSFYNIYFTSTQVLCRILRQIMQ